MKTTGPTDVRNATKLIAISNGPTWSRCVLPSSRDFSDDRASSFQAEISDATGSQWINVFRNEAEALLGLSADEFGNHRMNVRRSVNSFHSLHFGSFSKTRVLSKMWSEKR